MSAPIAAIGVVTDLVPYGRTQTSVDATLHAALGPFGFTRSAGLDQGVTGVGDLAPQFSLRWNEGVNNFMTYVTGNLTTGRYDPKRIANLGIGHNAIDGGGGYTYFNPQTGHELSAVLGVTYNYENEYTHYQNGVDMHLDWGASQFFLPNNFRSDLLAICMIKPLAIVALEIDLAVSNHGLLASVLKSDTSFLWENCRVT